MLKINIHDVKHSDAVLEVLVLRCLEDKKYSWSWDKSIGLEAKFLRISKNFFVKL